MCTHQEQSHVNGSCMHITQPDITGPTEDKYCPCGAQDGHNTRLFSVTGFMEPVFPDHMVTKKCAGCTQEVLLNLDETQCLLCKSRAAYQ